MLSFHNDPLIKEKYLSRVIKHRELDNIIQGIGWENGKGCSVGCTLENYNHDRYPIELGLPEWLARLEDAIFESLPNEEAIFFPEKFLSAIPVGVDVNNIKYKLSIARMDRLIEIQNKNLNLFPDLKDIFIKTISALELTRKCHESELNKSYCDLSAAWSAAWSAESAARSAARSAESAARSAAWSAESAAWSAESAEWKEESELLLKLLSECK